MKILFVDDDIETLNTLKLALKDYYIVETAQTGEEGEYKAQINEYDSLLIDYILPDMNGIEISKKLRASGVRTPIIMLTGNGEVKNKVSALNSGIDDYIVKPFDTDELRARIEAVIRRSLSGTSSNILSLADLFLDLDKRMVVRGGKEIVLQRKEMDLLEYLMRNVGKVMTRSMILDHIWDSSNETLNNVVDVHVKYLRDRIDRNFDKKLIKTVHGYGYKIEQ